MSTAFDIRATPVSGSLRRSLRNVEPRLPWWWIAAYAPLWAVGAAVLWWPATFLLITTTRRRFVLQPALVLLLTPLFLILSLIGAATARHGLLRVVAAVFLLLPWLVICAACAGRWTELDRRAVGQGLVTLGVVQGLLTVVAFWLYPDGQNAVLPLGHLLPSRITATPALSAYLTERLAFEDYFSGVVVRSSGLFGNPTWAGALAASALLVIMLRPSWVGGKRYWPLLVIAASACAFSLYVAYSRNTVLALVVGVVCGCTLRVSRKSPRLVAGFVVSALGAGAASLALVDLQGLFDRLNSARAGSLDSRREIYAQTLDQVHQHSLLLGSGVKEQGQDLVASLGTHSTLLGLIYRGGWLAFWGFIFFVLVQAVTAVARRDDLGLAAILFTLMYGFTEDLDAGHLAPLAVLLAVGARAAGSREAPARKMAERVVRLHDEGTGAAVTWLNHYSAMEVLRAPRDLLTRFDLVGVDGTLLRLMTGRRMPRTSADLVLPLVLPQLRHARVALVGGRPDDLRAREIAISAMLNPTSSVVSVIDGYGGLPDRVDSLSEWLAEIRPTIVIVGLGARRQEVFASYVHRRSPGTLAVTCGGFLDQVATGGYYPAWAYPLRLNWLVRLCREPRRMWRRYTTQALTALAHRRSLRYLVCDQRGYRELLLAIDSSRET